MASTTSPPLPFPTVGIIGGGQLGRMLCIASKSLGIRTVVLEADARCPAAGVCDEFILGSITDASKIAQLAAGATVITCEIEHINADALTELGRCRPAVQIHPSADTVALIQDKYAQKLALADADVPCGKFQAVGGPADIEAAAEAWGYPIMVKARRLAYDGRGNFPVHAAADIASAVHALAPKGGLYVEEWVPFVRELAVIVARNSHGCHAYPAVQTIQRGSVCEVVLAPAPVSSSTMEAAKRIAIRAVEKLSGCGVFGVELFELADGSVMLNEIAPRVHNSGHLTIEAAHCSQFEQHLRCILGWPLGSTKLRVPAAAMINIFGADESMESTWAAASRALSVPSASLHWYHKQTSRVGRKMGHVTLTGTSRMEVASLVELLTDGAYKSGDLVGTGAPLVSVIMGSDSDLPTMSAAATILAQFMVPFETRIISAHRTPEAMVAFARAARSRGIAVIIAGAGGAAHLPGMVAALTPVPVIGVPVPLAHLDGVDSLHSIVQMPKGIPVATVAIGNATNAALLAIRMLGNSMPHLADALEEYSLRMKSEVLAKDTRLEALGWQQYMVPTGSASAASVSKS